MVISDIADGIWRSVENAHSSVNEALFEPVIRLGVTGLARAGKTVFITSLVANLLDRNRMGHVSAIRERRVVSAYLQPQPDDTIARFDYETHLASLKGSTPAWPESTRSVSELRISLRIRSNGLLGGERVVHLDIIDYPGEWLLDLSLMELSFAEWSQNTLDTARQRQISTAFLDELAGTDASEKFDETHAKSLADVYTNYLHASRAEGLSNCTPGRFLLPGDLAGSPVLTFVPMPKTENAKRGSLYREMERRYEVYKSKVIRPFFRDHFAKLDRQIVLVDVLGAINAGPDAVEDMRKAMTGVLQAFRPGRNPFLRQLLLGKRVDKVLFAATKADHLHHKQHDKLSAIVAALVSDAQRRAEIAGASTQSMSLAALRASVEETRRHDGKELAMVKGTLIDGRQAALFAGDLPDDPTQILAPAREGARKWLDGDYSIMAFAPPKMTLKPGDGPPHIRLDRAVEYLVGDKL